MNLLFHTDEKSRLIIKYDWTIIYFNLAIAKVFFKLYSQTLTNGFYIKEYIDLPLLPFFQENFQSALEGQEIQSKKLIEIEGKEYWFQFSFYPLWDGTSKSNQILYLSENVTEEFQKEKKLIHLEKDREQRESYLKKSEDKWRSLVESSPNIIFTLDKHFNITYINYVLSGLKLKDLIGSNYLNYIQNEDLPNVIKYLEECLQKGIVREFEIRGSVKGELTAWYLVRIAPIRNNHSGDIESIMATASEITERKQMEAEVKESLEEKEILLKEIHHRVKNNLQIISSLLSLQSNQLGDEKLTRIFQTNITRIKSIAILHDMLNISTDPARISFKEYLKLITNYLLTIHGKNNQNVKILLEVEDTTITINQAIYFGLIVNELVSNSLQYAFPENKDGEIMVQAQLNAENKILLDISDNGIGISPEIELTNVKTLGLKLVQILAKQMQGTVSLEKKSGLVFHFFLPIDPQKN